MATNTPTISKTQTKQTPTKKQSKALEKSKTSSSAPWNKPSLSELQIKDSEKTSYSCVLFNRLPTAKPGLKSVQILAECLDFLHQLAEEVNNISQMKSSGKKVVAEDRTKEPSSLESSRSLILHWAKELESSMVQRKIRSTNEKTRRDDERKQQRTELEKHEEKLQQWAIELMNIKEANGVSDEELKKLLFPKGQKGPRVAAIIPLLEFVAWSLLSQDTEEAVSMMWLPTKQKAWKTTGTGIPRYIPHSVWQWIQSASVSVHLDASSAHSSLVVSSDRLSVQEAAVFSAVLSHNSQHSGDWPCVLGDTIITVGRHYWEVEVSPNGSWRIGVMSELAPKKRRYTMSPKRGYWTLWRGSSLWAFDDKPTKLEKAALLRCIGVYVDVEEGQVSFYDVERRIHIYTFSGTFKHSLVPLFGFLNGDTVLKITPKEISVTAVGK